MRFHISLKSFPFFYCIYASSIRRRLTLIRAHLSGHWKKGGVRGSGPTGLVPAGQRLWNEFSVVRRSRLADGEARRQLRTMQDTSRDTSITVHGCTEGQSCVCVRACVCVCVCVCARV